MISDLNSLSDSAKIEIRTYSEILKTGGVIAFPTETVYGLGASAWNPSAISKVFEIKGRPADNPLIVHISNYGMLLQFAAEILPESRLLMQKFWPGPLTLIFERKSRVLDSITAGLNSVAIRMPDHAYALKLIDLAGPLVAPSANISGSPSPTSWEHVRADFGSTLPVLNGGDCIIGLESTVVDVRQLPFRILRPGRISANMILEHTGIQVETAMKGDMTSRPLSPGMKYTHYAPKTTISWIKSDDDLDQNVKTLYLVQDMIIGPSAQSTVIKYDGDLEKMARELFDWFRKSDIEGYDTILIEKLDQYMSHELFDALTDRISKAISGK